ncbi:Cell division control protein 45 [Nakaseomyces glabratus]|nr:Cell division control protein 45 [Nakaseomyces glabratus]KTB03974.1 Cell division control protein 45 [Nakaseomyces glabratus]KTB14093.1 Cell division control protein 45 [Nakaseomyces glabratus]
MYYAVDKYGEAYNTIVRSCSSHSSCQLVLFVSCLNVDALCAAKILSLLFKKQLIQSQIVPVFGYSELKTHYDQIDDNVNTVMFIGFGGVVDLETFLEIDPEEYITENAKWKKRVSKRYIYVWDAQRPWNLDNLFGSEIVQCFDDGTIHKYESIIDDYYAQGVTVVNSLAAQVYSLLSSIGETTLQNLWLTILGTTSLDTAFTQIYNRLCPLLQDEVRRLSPKSTGVKTPDTLTLNIQPDYYLFLLRHSSLYDSFYFSNYVNAKLSLWNESGKKRLHKMFARMGIPLTTAQESWLYMDHSIKRELGVIFDKNLDRYGLQDIVRDGFVRSFGYRGSISASEHLEALNALLEVGEAIHDDGISSKDEEDETLTEQENKSLKLHKRWLSNFWLSWDALDDKKLDILKLGIQHAQILQRAIFNTGVTVLEKKMIKHLRIYRLCVLREGPDLDLYRNPLTLLRLGNWLMECCAESEDKQLLPMVLASLDEATDTYLVAGLAPRYPRGLDMLQNRKPILNNFSMAFQQITAQTGAKVKIDNFESSIIEIKKADLSPFLEKLTLSGLI